MKALEIGSVHQLSSWHGWDFASLADAGMSSSSSMTKSLNSCESSSISKAEQYGNSCGYVKLKSSRQGRQMQTLK